MALTLYRRQQPPRKRSTDPIVSIDPGGHITLLSYLTEQVGDAWQYVQLYWDFAELRLVIKRCCKDDEGAKPLTYCTYNRRITAKSYFSWAKIRIPVVTVRYRAIYDPAKQTISAYLNQPIGTGRQRTKKGQV
jgi:hypothetical protein